MANATITGQIEPDNVTAGAEITGKIKEITGQAEPVNTTAGAEVTGEIKEETTADVEIMGELED